MSPDEFLIEYTQVIFESEPRHSIYLHKVQNTNSHFILVTFQKCALKDEAGDELRYIQLGPYI